MKNPICIYHANCMDGFAAAWAVWKRFPDWEFYADVHQTPPPDVTGRDVVLVDFSYKRAVIEDMADKANSILILDHHESAANDLAGLYTMSSEVQSIDQWTDAKERINAEFNDWLVKNEHEYVPLPERKPKVTKKKGKKKASKKPAANIEDSPDHLPTPGELPEEYEVLPVDTGPARIGAVFDMDRSGAMIAWGFFHPGEFVPPLMRNVQDRDLWRFALPNTEAICAAVFAYPYTFSVYSDLMERPRTELVKEGRGIVRKHHKDVAELVSVCQRRLTIAGHDVPVASLPLTYTSDAGLLMAAGEPFAACYWDTPTGRVFSLRSQRHGMNVADIAVQYGGGGHRHAAGFEVPRDHELATS